MFSFLRRLTINDYDDGLLFFINRVVSPFINRVANSFINSLANPFINRLANPFINRLVNSFIKNEYIIMQGQLFSFVRAYAFQLMMGLGIPLFLLIRGLLSCSLHLLYLSAQWLQRDPFFVKGELFYQQ